MTWDRSWSCQQFNCFGKKLIQIEIFFVWREGKAPECGGGTGRPGRHFDVVRQVPVQDVTIVYFLLLKKKEKNF